MLSLAPSTTANHVHSPHKDTKKTMKIRDAVKGKAVNGNSLHKLEFLKDASFKLTKSGPSDKSLECSFTEECSTTSSCMDEILALHAASQKTNKSQSRTSRLQTKSSSSRSLRDGAAPTSPWMKRKKQQQPHQQAQQLHQQDGNDTAPPPPPTAANFPSSPGKTFARARSFRAKRNGVSRSRSSQSSLTNPQQDTLSEMRSSATPSSLRKRMDRAASCRSVLGERKTPAFTKELLSSSHHRRSKLSKSPYLSAGTYLEETSAHSRLVKEDDDDDTEEFAESKGEVEVSFRSRAVADYEKMLTETQDSLHTERSTVAYKSNSRTTTIPRRRNHLKPLSLTDHFLKDSPQTPPKGKGSRKKFSSSLSLSDHLTNSIDSYNKILEETNDSARIPGSSRSVCY